MRTTSSRAFGMPEINLAWEAEQALHNPFSTPWPQA